MYNEWNRPARSFGSAQAGETCAVSPAKFGARSARPCMPLSRVRPIRRPSRCEVLEARLCLKLSRSRKAAHGERFTPSATGRPSTFCTPSRKNRKGASPLRKKTLTSSITAWLRRNASTGKGRTNMATRTRKPIRMEKSSGNVFADLGLPHPEQELLKAELTLQIFRLIKQRGLKQADAGKVLGIKQPHVSALMRNRAGSFSVERLMDFLAALGQNVQITVKPARKKHGEVSLVA